MNKKMKRILAAITAAAAMSSLCCTPLADLGVKLPLNAIEANAAETITSGDYQYTLSDDGATIKKYTGSDTEITVPTELDGNKVFAIGNGAFQYNKNITSVVIPSGIQKVYSFAFDRCSNLSSVTLSEGITFLGNYSFSNTAITEVTLPSTLTDASYPFSGCKITKAVFAEGTTAVPSFIFDRNKELKEVVIPKTVEKIHSYAFSGCSSLTEFDFHEGITFLGNNAFSNTGLTEVTLPSTLTDASYPFSGCKITKAVFAEGATAVPSFTFDNCKELKEVVLPKTVEKIHSYAFSGCSSLTEFDFHDGITFLGNYAFSNTGLTEVTLPSTLTDSTYPFSGCKITKAVFAEGATVVPSFTFDNCKELKEVVLPKTVEKIHSYAFSGCSSLTEFDFHEGITFLGNYAFSGTGLTEVTLPSTLTDSTYPFSGSKITKAVFADGAKAVPSFTFDNCKELKEVVLPETVEKIHSYAFSDCSSLTEFNFHEGITFIGSEAFTRSGVTEVTLPSTLEDASYAFSRSNIKKASIADGTEKLPNYVFSGANQLKEVVLPESLKIIGSSAFENCTSLSSIELPSALEKLYSSCFNNTGLTSIEIPDSVTEISNSAFKGCKKLKTVSLGASLKQLYDDAFSNCTALEKVVFNSENVKVGNRVFTNCRSLSDVDYSKTTLKCQRTAFTKCYSLKDTNLVFLTRPDSNMTITTEKAAVDGTVDITVEFEALAGHYSDDTDFTLSLTIPKGVTVLPDTFKTDAGNIEIDEASSIKIPFSTSRGKLTFSVKATESGVYDIDADLLYKDITKNVGTREEPIHSVRFTADVLSLSAPSIINDLKTSVSGTGPKGQTVEIYLGDKLIGNPTTNEKTGRFDIPIELPEAENGTEFVIKAKYGDIVTSDCTILYSKEDPSINSIKFGINGKKADNDITDVFTKCTSPVMYLRPSKELTFAADITNSQNVEKVFFTSTKGNKVAKMEANYDEESGLWIANGYFDNNKDYVPGTLNVVLVSKAKANALSAAKLDIDYTDGYYSRPGNIRFIIDPSGIVYEGAPSNGVKGAEMTIYYLDEEGNAVAWDGTDFDQQNPLLTDEFGAYAWDVPEGQWKVVCKAEGFETQESEWKNVPPAQTDINFSLVSTAVPEVTDISYDESNITLQFSKYMLPDSVNTGTVLLDAGTDIEITPEYHASDEEVTDTFIIKGDFTDVIDVNVNVTDGCFSYANTASAAYEKSLHINDAPETTTTTAETTTTTTTTTAAPETTTTTSEATTTVTEPATTTTSDTPATTTTTTTSSEATTTVTEPATTTTSDTPATTTTTTTTTSSEPVTTTTKPSSKYIYSLTFRDADTNDVISGVKFTLTTNSDKDEDYGTITSDGLTSVRGYGNKFTVKIVELPEGYAPVKDDTFSTENINDLVSIFYISKDGTVKRVAYSSSVTTTAPASTTVTTTTTTTTSSSAPATTTTQTSETKGGSFGDLNGDGKINAMDATYILTIYAEMSTSNDRKATDDEIACGDVNKDGKLNAVDASYVLSYYAYISTNEKISIEEYLKK